MDRQKSLKVSKFFLLDFFGSQLPLGSPVFLVGHLPGQTVEDLLEVELAVDGLEESRRGGAILCVI